MDEAERTPETEVIRVATGLLLPIWSALPSEHLTVNRIVDADGNSWLGRFVFDGDVVKLLSRLGLGQADDLPADAIAAAVLAGQPVDLVRPFPVTARRARVNGAHRIELVGCPAPQLPWLKSIGCFTEIIQYRTRVFVPTAAAEPVFARLLKSA